MSWWWIALIVPAYFVQTLVHEGAHAIFYTIAGYRVISFKIWPHFVKKDHDHDPKTPDREFFFWGRVVPTVGSRVITTKVQRISMHFAPWLVGIPFWIAITVMIMIGSPSFLLIFLGATTIDLVRASVQPWWREKRGDANRGGEEIGWSHDDLKTYGGILALILAAGCATVATLTLV